MKKYNKAYKAFLEQYNVPTQTAYTKAELVELISDLFVNILNNPAAKINKQSAMAKLETYLKMLHTAK